MRSWAELGLGRPDSDQKCLMVKKCTISSGDLVLVFTKDLFSEN